MKVTVRNIHATMRRTSGLLIIVICSGLGSRSLIRGPGGSFLGGALAGAKWPRKVQQASDEHGNLHDLLGMPGPYCKH